MEDFLKNQRKQQKWNRNRKRKEELTSAIATAYNVETGKVDKTKLKDALGTGWSLAEGDTAPYTVTSPKGNKFTVSTDGTIEYTGKEEILQLHHQEMMYLQHIQKQ